MKKFICMVVVVWACIASAVAQEFINVRQKCPQCWGYGMVTSFYGPVYCPTCSGHGVVVTIRNPNYNPYQTSSNVAFRANGDKFVYVKGAKHSSSSGCRCDGYKGYQTPSGLYKGKCQNTDGWGHTCGHSPSSHGLKE